MWTLESGIRLKPWDLNSSSEAAAGARPLPLMALTFFSWLFQTRANMSPPTPVDIGSTTFRAAAAATAASTAFPPWSIMRKPATAANGWLVATIPFFARTVERRESKNIDLPFRGSCLGMPNKMNGLSPFASLRVWGGGVNSLPRFFDRSALSE